MTQPKCLEYALNSLNRRWRTTFELTKKLQEKRYDDQDIKQTIKFLIDKNLLNDERYTISWIRSRLSLHPSGRSLIDLELIKKGVPKDTIIKSWQKISSEQNEEYDAFNVALEAARHKMRSYQNLPPDIFSRRMMNFLARRGFSYDIIKKVLAELTQRIV